LVEGGVPQIVSLETTPKSSKWPFRAIVGGVAFQRRCCQLTTTGLGAYSPRDFVRLPMGAAWPTKKYRHPHRSCLMECLFFDFQSCGPWALPCLRQSLR